MGTPDLGAQPLSAALREGSRAEHEEAESSDFVTELMAGRAHPGQYAAYLRRLRVVYAALEAAVRDHRDDRAVGQVYDESLTRVPALDRDLDHWAPGADPATTSTAAAAYRDRIEEARTRPHLLVAHHYTRYLGDLSGGQLVAQSLRRGYAGLESDGLAFYTFPDIAKPGAYKRAYRARLDGLDLTAPDRSGMVEEVRRAFRLNRDVFREVAGLGPADHSGYSAMSRVSSTTVTNRR